MAEKRGNLQQRKEQNHRREGHRTTTERSRTTAEGELREGMRRWCGVGKVGGGGKAEREKNVE